MPITNHIAMRQAAAENWAAMLVMLESPETCHALSEDIFRLHQQPELIRRIKRDQAEMVVTLALSALCMAYRDLVSERDLRGLEAALPRRSHPT